ncbi:MAG: hypothetical protein FWF68_03160 [Spirochaetes bacterium]|nr:hypothetical protein [Spirochaetota bacterium]
MRENKSARNCLIIAAVILAVTVPFLTVNYIRTKKNLEKFNAASGKYETLGFSQVVQASLKGKEYGVAEEDARFASLPSNKEVVEIKEKMFIAQTNDVYLNTEDYLGKTIKLEGLFKQDDAYDKSYFFVIRYGPGCCGFDANAGFEVAWINEKAKAYPAVDSWVEAVGTLKTYEEDDMQYLYLDLSSLNVLKKRGAEYVNQ